jgi:hypothetical protein
MDHDMTTPIEFQVAIREHHPCPAMDTIYVLASDSTLESLHGSLIRVTDILDWDPQLEAENPMYFIGRNHSGKMGEWGCYTNYITFDYTNYMRKTTAALRIQANWQKYRKNKAAKTIQNAWLRWVDRKNTNWNPYTFVGIVDMMVNYIRTVQYSTSL